MGLQKHAIRWGSRAQVLAQESVNSAYGSGAFTVAAAGRFLVDQAHEKWVGVTPDVTLLNRIRAW